jgi:hypothetical protein
MTHNILHSDVTLAKRLMNEQRPDQEIIQALVHRCVDAAQAAKLLDDLRSGGKVTVQSTLPSEMGLLRRSRSRKSASGHGEGSPAPSREPESRQQPPPSRAPRGRKQPKVAWGVIVAVVILVIAAASFTLYWRARAGAPAEAEPAPKAASPVSTEARQSTPTAVAAAARAGAATSVVLELQPDGLRIGGNLVSRGDSFSAVTKLLGPPTRTNQVAQTGTFTYAYDRHGVLIYARPGGAASSIVLDCEATGGANGTTSPFAGTLKIEGQVISPDTDSRALANIKKLSLGNPRSGGTIWGGRYENMELVFAYLKSPSHLSHIEIDLK